MQWLFYNLSIPLEFFSPPKFCQVCKHQSASKSREEIQPPSPLLIGRRVRHPLYFTGLFVCWPSILVLACDSPTCFWLEMKKCEVLRSTVIDTLKLSVASCRCVWGKLCSILWIPSFSCKQIYWSRARSAERKGKSLVRREPIVILLEQDT